MEKEKKSAKLVFASRLAPKTGSVDDVAGSIADGDLGIQITSKLQARLPVVAVAGRTTAPE